MDEAEKYKQRLEAIAEKRRLQEEQDKARREKEDERLRQQQLKRKSLRDQWLMEGSPLSPSSPNTQNTFSSLWGTQDQDMEKHTEKLQEDQEVTPQGDHETEAVELEEIQAEITCSSLENGDSTALGNETPCDEVNLSQNPPQDESAVVLTNGGASGEGNCNPTPSETSMIAPVGTTKDASSVEMESEINVTAAAFSQVPNANMNKEEEGEDGTLVMRAECVYITDEGDDVPGELSSLKDQQESMQNPVEGQETVEIMEQVLNTEGVQDTSPESENAEAAALTVKEPPPPYEDRGDMIVSTEESNVADEEMAVQSQDQKLEDPDGPLLKSTTNGLDGSTVVKVPVYTEAPSSALISEAEAKDEVPAVSKKAEEAVKVEEPACKPGQFQEVLLNDSQENQSTEAEPGEQEGLLQKVPASILIVESPGINRMSWSETGSPHRAAPRQGEMAETPKRKTCQCCSLM